MKIKNVNDYVQQVHEKFPELTEAEIKRILVYGWKQIIQYVSAGNDVSITTAKFFFFIGKIPHNALSTFKNYSYKLAKKIAYMFQRTKSKWDGYYYFTRSENQYQEYLKQKKRKYKIFKDVFLHKLYEEVRIKDSSNPYIFRLSEDRTSWMRRYYPEIRTDKAELIEIRDSLNMKDLLTSQNKFKYINNGTSS